METDHYCLVRMEVEGGILKVFVEEWEVLEDILPSLCPYLGSGSRFGGGHLSGREATGGLEVYMRARRRV